MTMTWNDQESLPTVRVPSDDDRRLEKLYLFGADQPVGGKVDIIMPANTKKIEHNGIKAELIGQIELAYDRGNHYIFFSAQKELSGPGVLAQDSSFKFEFAEKDNDKKYEAYDGINVRLRYSHSLWLCVRFYFETVSFRKIAFFDGMTVPSVH